jgi:transcriptional regulator with XRE-family HTH domain
MSPDDVRALRKELGVTARELARALDEEQETVLAWERGESFPTKRLVTRMEGLRAGGPSAMEPFKTRPRRAVASSPYAVLADPAFHRLVRKLLAHPELRRQAEALASTLPDPADEG